MLLAVEGVGFFSSSASGYSKGLSLLLLGRRSGERPMRVLPCNHYQLVEPDIQLASIRKRVSRGCTPFICFTRASAGADGPPPVKVGLVNQSVTLPDPCIPDTSKDCTVSASADESESKVCLKSNLKKPLSRCSPIAGEGDHADNSIKEVQRNVGFTERRVQWIDSCGRELVEIREFEPSDDGSSDDEFEHERNQRCECVIQ